MNSSKGAAIDGIDLRAHCKNFQYIFDSRSASPLPMHQQAIAERLLEEVREKLDFRHFGVRDRTSRKSPKKHPPFRVALFPRNTGRGGRECEKAKTTAGERLQFSVGHVIVNLLCRKRNPEGRMRASARVRAFRIGISKLQTNTNGRP